MRRYECVCGRTFASKGWLTRHHKTCAVWQATPMMEIVRGVMLRVTPQLVTAITRDNALFKRLSEPNDKRVPWHLSEPTSASEPQPSSEPKSPSAPVHPSEPQA